ncbi:MAG: hypothetical protein NVSMB52_13000 [Chloroflexota bacterium]
MLVIRALVSMLKMLIASLALGMTGYFQMQASGAQAGDMPGAFGATRRPSASGHWQILGYARSGPTLFLPSAVVTDRQGDVYVLDKGNSRVVEIAATGRVLRAWSVAQPSEPRLDMGLASMNPPRILPSSIGVDVEGNVYVPSDNTNCVRKYSNRGRLLMWPLPRGICLSPRYDGGLEVAVGNRGNIFLANGPRIAHYSPAGRLLANWGGFGPDRRGLAIALAADHWGNVFALVSYALKSCCPVSGGTNGNSATGYRIEKRSPAGKLLTHWQTGTGAEVSISASLAVDQQGNVYLDDWPAHRIVKFSPTGRVVVERNEYGTALGQFRFPNGLAVGPRGSVFVADTINNRVQKLTQDLRPLGQWGVGGDLTGQLSFPTAVAVSRDGTISVGDEGNGRIVQFGPAGRVEAMWSPAGFSPDSLLMLGRKPLAVSMHGDVYTADAWSGRVLRFSRQGRLLAKGACPSPECPGYADGPRNLAIGRDGVYVGAPVDLVKLSTHLAVLARRRLLIERLASDPHGTVYASVLLAHQNCCNVAALTPDGHLAGGAAIRHQIYSWGGMAVDASDNVYVSETDGDIVTKFSPSGQLLARWGRPGSGAGEFHAPTGIAVDTRGNLYVADTGNDRIQELVVGR